MRRAGLCRLLVLAVLIATCTRSSRGNSTCEPSHRNDDTLSHIHIVPSPLSCLGGLVVRAPAM